MKGKLLENNNPHKSVLLHEAVNLLITNPKGVYVDATFGRGGHSSEILQHLSEDGILIGIDKDHEAIACGEAFAKKDPRFAIHRSDFANIDQLLAATKIDGILLDLGVSSPQLDNGSRGFSFMRDGPLDMRMDNRQHQTAATWLARASEQEMRQVFWDYGEERYARRISRAICTERQTAPILSTQALVDLIINACPRSKEKKHPATRTFQAIRIYINKELESLERLLQLSLNQLKPGGRLVVISFHSLEDRIVKRFMRNQQKGDNFPRKLPIQGIHLNQKLKILGKPLKASTVEIEQNPRARSAIMRVAETLKKP